MIIMSGQNNLKKQGNIFEIIKRSESNGVASLDEAGKVPLNELPEFSSGDFARLTEGNEDLVNQVGWDAPGGLALDLVDFKNDVIFSWHYSYDDFPNPNYYSGQIQIIVKNSKLMFKFTGGLDDMESLSPEYLSDYFEFRNNNTQLYIKNYTVIYHLIDYIDFGLSGWMNSFMETINTNPFLIRTVSQQMFEDKLLNPVQYNEIANRPDLSKIKPNLWHLPAGVYKYNQDDLNKPIDINDWLVCKKMIFERPQDNDTTGIALIRAMNTDRCFFMNEHYGHYYYGPNPKEVTDSTQKAMFMKMFKALNTHMLNTMRQTNLVNELNGNWAVGTLMDPANSKQIVTSWNDGYTNWRFRARFYQETTIASNQTTQDIEWFTLGMDVSWPINDVHFFYYNKPAGSSTMSAKVDII